MLAGLHAQEQPVEHHHAADGEYRVVLPQRRGDQFGYDHGDAHRGEDHGHVGLAGVVVVRLLAVLEAAEQRGEAEDAVHVQHHRRVDGVAGQGRRMVVAHHDGQDDHLHQHRGEGQDHRAIGLADLLREDFRVVRDAQRDADDRRQQHRRGRSGDGLAAFQQAVFQRIDDDREEQGDEEEFFLSEQAQHGGGVHSGRATIILAAHVGWC
ncbi:hypothetical protein D3C81_1551650 [compost metagenome]